MSLACPWAHRSVIVRRLLGLEDALALRVVDPLRDEQGWRFTLDDGGVDPITGASYVMELYRRSDPEFDAAYHGHFTCNERKLTEFAHLWPYARDLFQTPGFGDTTDFAHVKSHYYGTHDKINPTLVVPKGPDLSGWDVPHGLDHLGHDLQVLAEAWTEDEPGQVGAGG